MLQDDREFAAIALVQVPAAGVSMRGSFSQIWQICSKYDSIAIAMHEKRMASATASCDDAHPVLRPNVWVAPVFWLLTSAASHDISLVRALGSGCQLSVLGS